MIFIFFFRVFFLQNVLMTLHYFPHHVVGGRGVEMYPFEDVKWEINISSFNYNLFDHNYNLKLV